MRDHRVNVKNMSIPEIGGRIRQPSASDTPLAGNRHRGDRLGLPRAADVGSTCRASELPELGSCGSVRRPYVVRMTRPAGRRLDPMEVFEVTPWRALALFRLGTLVYAIALTAHNVGRHAHPTAAWSISGVMVVWSAVTIAAYERPRTRAWPMLAADMAVTVGCLLSTRWVVGVEDQLPVGQLPVGVPTLTLTWMACPVLAVAVVRGPLWGVAAALAMGSCDLWVRGAVNQSTITGTEIMVMAAAAVGYLGNIATKAQEALRLAAAMDAARAERERLARGIHDSVLQVLSLVQRRGEEIGGEAAELGRLAGEQEVALRSLIASEERTAAPGMTDLRAAIAGLAAADVSVATPATEVWLPTREAAELVAAVGAALDNVRQHCPAGTRAWILVEEENGEVTVTVRDNGPGIPAGRLSEAASQGRLGVAQSICGRLADLGGTASITSSPGAGTEIELRLRRTAAALPAAPA